MVKRVASFEPRVKHGVFLIQQHLLQAEQIVFSVMGADNDYMKTIYRHLYSLYARWNKPELAEKYKQKLLPIKRS